MDLSKEQFDHQFKETLDTLLEQMAENSEINLDKFYSMTCILENLAFFSPVIYEFIQKSKK